MSRRVLRLVGPVVSVGSLKRAGAGCFVANRWVRQTPSNWLGVKWT